MRPDFGSGLLGAGLRARRPRARRGHAVPGAGRARQWLGAPDRGRGGRGRADRRRAAGHGRVRRRYAPSEATHATSPRASGAPTMIYACCDERRLQAVKLAGVLNGIEYLEVPTPRSRPASASARCSCGCSQPAAGNSRPEQRRQSPAASGSRRSVWSGSSPADALPAGEEPALVAGLDDPDHVLVVRTDGRGDFSSYTLALVAAPAARAADGFDPLLAEVDFSFKVECPTPTSTARPSATAHRGRPPRRRSTTWPRTTRPSGG